MSTAVAINEDKLNALLGKVVGDFGAALSADLVYSACPSARRRTAALTGRSERMRASDPVEREGRSCHTRSQNFKAAGHVTSKNSRRMPSANQMKRYSDSWANLLCFMKYASIACCPT